MVCPSNDRRTYEEILEEQTQLDEESLSDLEETLADPTIDPPADDWDERDFCENGCGCEATHYIEEVGIWYCGRRKCFAELYEAYMYH